MSEGALNCKRFSLGPIHVSRLSGVTYFVCAARARFRNESFEAWLEDGGIYSTLTLDPSLCHGTTGVQKNTL